MAVDEGKLMEFLGQFVGDLGRDGVRRLGGPRRPPGSVSRARAVPGDAGASWPSAPAPTSGTSRSGCAARPPAATSTYDAAAATYSLTRGAGVRAHRPRPARCSCPARSSSRWARSRRRSGSRSRSAPVPAWAGTSTTPTCSSGASASSVPATSPTSCPRGSPRSTACRPSSRPARAWPTSGCGHGASTILLAQAYPNSTFVGSDYHEGSIEAARKQAADAGVADRVSFEVASAQGFAGTGYDLVATFDCLHDMGDPVGAARHVRESLAPDGTWLIVEPAAGDTVTDNLNPVGRVYYSFSTLLCVPNAMSQTGGHALGRPGGRGGHPQGRRGGRVHPVPSGGRDPVQPASSRSVPSRGTRGADAARRRSWPGLLGRRSVRAE